MVELIEGDGFLDQQYSLADCYGWPIGAVKSMTLTDFYGHLAFLDIKRKRVKAAQEPVQDDTDFFGE